MILVQMVRKILSFTVIVAVSLLLFLPASTDWGEPDGKKRLPDFTFLRLIYSGEGWRGWGWATDYPKADQQFLYGLQKLSDFTFVSSEHKALPIVGTEVFEYPFLYAVEVGNMTLSELEVTHLREYLLRGGFLVVDDFHGSYEWNHFYRQIKKVFPEYEPTDLPLSHPIFHCYYDIDRLIQIPGLQYVYSGRTWEKGGYKARYMGIQDEDGRLMVMINHNVDLGDAWEWAEVEVYPRHYATLAFQLGINYIVYAMTH